MKRKNAPSKKKIVSWWIDNYEVESLEENGHLGRGHECGMGADMSEWEERCWCCGRLEDLERCHIVPHSVGGSNHPSNFVLLCYSCHIDAPNVNDKHEMWRYIYKNRGTFYFDKEQQDWIDEQLSELIKHTTVHFGQGGINNSTKEWINREMSKRFINKYLPKLNQL
jgi:hypothetical protein